MRNENDQRHTDENSKPEGESENQTYDWRETFRRTFHDSFKNVWAKLIGALAIFLVSQWAGYMLNKSPKGLILGAAVGLTILFWIFVISLIKHTTPVKDADNRPAKETPNEMKDGRPNKSISTVNQSGGQNIIAGGDVNLGIPPREITPESRQKLLASLASAPKGQVAVISLMGDGESALFASRIMKVLTEAGYNVHDGSTGNVQPPEFGLVFWDVKPPKKRPPYFEPLFKAFNEAGIAVHVSNGYGAHPEEQVYIFVAARPPE